MDAMRLWRHRNGVFYVIHAGGRMQSLRTREKPTADRLFKKLLAAHLEGRLIEIKRSEMRLLEDFAMEYQKTRTGLAKSTQKADRLSLAHFLDFFGNRPMAAITADVLDKYRGHLRDKYTSTETVNDYIRGLKTALKIALKWGYVRRRVREGDPGVEMEEFKQFKVDRGVPTFATPADVLRLILAAQEHPVMARAVPVMFYTGISRAEIINPLVILEDAIEYRRQKTGRLIRVPILDGLRPYLRLPVGIHRLVPWKNPRTFSRHFGRIVDAAGLKGITPHKVRHTFATTALTNGVPIEVVSKALGHSSIAITIALYGHVMPQYIRSELAKLRY